MVFHEQSSFPELASSAAKTKPSDECIKCAIDHGVAPIKKDCAYLVLGSKQLVKTTCYRAKLQEFRNGQGPYYRRMVQECNKVCKFDSETNEKAGQEHSTGDTSFVNLLLYHDRIRHYIDFLS